MRRLGEQVKVYDHEKRQFDVAFENHKQPMDGVYFTPIACMDRYPVVFFVDDSQKWKVTK